MIFNLSNPDLAKNYCESIQVIGNGINNAHSVAK